MIEKKKLPIGEEFFRNIRTKGFYYVDKTGFISELLKTRGSVNLFTRPRRFGKSLNIDMLKTFFEKELDEVGNVLDNRHYFDGMKIMSAGEKYISNMGQYPVIFLSLKSTKQADMATAVWMLKKQIAGE